MNWLQKNSFLKLAGILSGSLLLSLTPLNGRAEVRSDNLLLSSVPIHLRQEARAKIKPIEGEVDVKLVNRTNAPIRYQALGDTRPRTLHRWQSETLLNLDTPANLTFYREDGGLVKVNFEASESGTLEAVLTDTSLLEADRSALWVAPDGTVYVN